MLKNLYLKLSRICNALGIVIIGALMISITSCQDADMSDAAPPSSDASSVSEASGIIIDTLVHDNAQEFSFEAITSRPEWKYSEDMSWRLSQIQIPESELAVMPTSTLVELCLDYPFAFDYTAANDCEDGIRRLMPTFNGFGELAKRQDAVKEPIMFAYIGHILSGVK